MLLRKLHLAVLVLAGSAICSSYGWAQTVKPYATVEGNVFDQYNTPIAGVAVLITNGGTYKVSTVTDKNGNYVLKNIHRYVGSTQTLVTYNILVSGAAINSYKSGAITFLMILI